MIPAGYTGTSARPILFTFHGGAETLAEFSAQHPDLFAKCNAEGMFLVLPEATIHPQSRDTLWGNKPFDLVVDDRVFVTNLLEQLDAALNVDRKRVYAAGFSNGGRFCNWLGATWPGLLAGLAPVCSQIGWNDPVTGALVAPPAPLEPLPVMMVRGSLDPRQPFFGSTNVAGQLTFSAADDLAFWVNANLCLPPPVTNTVGIISSWHYTTCDAGTEALLEGVSGLGHEWPEAPAYNASVRVVDFLLLFARP
jgi:polyhydroxybutyrate depolymerase